MRKSLILITCLLLFSIHPARAQFRVLLYHAHPNFGFSDSLFTQHMDFLEDNDYHTVTMDQFLDWRINNEPLPIRPLLVTFDDNYIRVYSVAYPVMQSRNLLGINFTHTDYVGVGGANDHCDWTEIQEMENAGVMITESHTKTHPNLTSISETQAQEEIEGSKQAIETNLTDKTCKTIAYPYGAYDADVITKCQNAGYTAGFTVGDGINYRHTPLFELERIGVDGATLETFKNKIGYYNLPPAPPGEGWTLDNKQVHFRDYTSSWFKSTTTSGYYHENYLFHEPGDGAHQVRWAAYLPQSGLYRVHAWWTSHSNRTQSAQYEIHHRDGITTVTMDQTQNGGQWNSLEEFSFTTDSAAMVYLADSSDGYTIADGIWFEPVTSEVTGWMYY